MTQTVSDNLALRLGLGAKALHHIELKSFIQLLIDELGDPLSEKKLRRLNPKTLFGLLQTLSSDIERSQSNHAFAILTSDDISPMKAPDVPEKKPLPAPKLRIAVSSNSEEMLDGHFGSCLRMLVYEVTADTYQLQEVRCIDTEEHGLARTDYLIDLIRDCDLLSTLSIGGPAAAKVTRADIHPIKNALPTPADEVLKQIQTVLAGTPPKWLQKKLDASHTNTQAG